MVVDAQSAKRSAAAERPAPADVPDGDAGAYLEELLEPGAVELPSTGGEAAEDLEAVELAGPHLRLAGSIGLGRFRRLSDLLNHHDGPLVVRDATILRRNGTATHVTTPSIWVNLADVTLIGQTSEIGHAPPAPEMRIDKERRFLVVVTPGHTLTGDVYIPVGGQLAVFIESVDPPFIPMTNVRTRSLADRRIITTYGFALLNRRQIVAATEAPPGIQVDRRGI
jgi:hypothetical protein